MNNWRLPTKEELNEMHTRLHLNTTANGHAWYQGFDNDNQSNSYKACKWIRLVRDLSEGDTCERRVFSVNGKNIEMAENDEPNLMAWGEAMRKYGREVENNSFETTTVPEVKLNDCFDARVWAKEFCKLNTASDEGTMISWFANAIMAGYDYAIHHGKK